MVCMSISYYFESVKSQASDLKYFHCLSLVFVSMESRLQIVNVSQIGNLNTSEPTVVVPSGNRILRELS